VTTEPKTKSKVEKEVKACPFKNRDIIKKWRKTITTITLKPSSGIWKEY